MKTILVATDFSKASVNAARYAVEIAAILNASLHILHVYQLPVSYGDISFAVASGEIEKDAQDLMKAFQSQLTNANVTNVEIKTEVRLGDFLDELAKVCKKNDPYLVVFGIHKSTAAKRFFFGSQAIFAMKHIEWPLVLVPEHAHFRSLKNIAIACDLIQVAATVPVEKVKMLVNDFGGKLHILNAGSNARYHPDIVFESGLLREVLPGVDQEYHFIESRDIDQGITDFVDKRNIDLLLVTPKKHDFFERLFLTSHTKELALMSNVPVMSLHI
jgi:nucleotide-binding universal stress UspA family protein